MENERPASSPKQNEIWGSDAIAAMLRALDIPYVALNPGASFRGLHDSLVNYLGNERPQLLLCLHEESAVAIAHGYAKASGRMMGVALHSNVGLMHATMAIFNAWCDRVPMLILGATGPWDAARRRPWIDWIHTSSDQGALVRDYTKWDNQPASVPAAYEALLRAAQIANTAPRGPTYVNLDAALQETKIGPLPALPDVSRYRAPEAVLPKAELIDAAAQLL
jgi:thiamine pyrophosphate-dependent acetolactate synthase large subunit-like protein